MSKYAATVNKSYIRQGASYAIGTIIDAYLSQADQELLYKSWQANWSAPLAFSGGIKAITCEQILEIPEDHFLAAFPKKQRTQAANILRIAKSYTG